VLTAKGEGQWAWEWVCKAKFERERDWREVGGFTIYLLLINFFYLSLYLFFLLSFFFNFCCGAYVCLAVLCCVHLWRKRDAKEIELRLDHDGSLDRCS
jgi:hypothetical protein